jgi:hypothetical protein
MTLPYTGEFRRTNRPAMSKSALCLALDLQYNEVSIEHSPASSSGTLQTIRSASTWPPGVLITYGASIATIDSIAFLAHVELIKSCDALESNSMIIGRPLSMNIPASTSSLVGILSTVV